MSSNHAFTYMHTQIHATLPKSLNMNTNVTSMGHINMGMIKAKGEERRKRGGS